MSPCTLCSALDFTGAHELWNEPLFESPNFVALPSLGALVPGWLLLVPKRHYLCIGALPAAMYEELAEMKQLVSSALSQCYGKLCVFEHGPSAHNRAVGCGVDHAHLHLVPVALDLVAETTALLPQGVLWAESGAEGCKEAYLRGEDYLYFERPPGSGLLAAHRQFGSQIFRQAIASHLGLPNEFNWREYPQLPNIATTIESMRSWARDNISCLGVRAAAA